MTNAHNAYREAAVQGASAVRLVVLLYEQAIKDLRQAAQAMDEGKVEVRTNHLNHALEIIGRLEGTLDTERGGKVSQQLATFYQAMRANLWKAQLQVSKPILLHQITDLLTLREAWVEVDRAESKGSIPQVAPPKAVAPKVVAPKAVAPGMHSEQSEERVPASWNG